LRRILISLLILTLTAAASTVGSVRGIIHDPQHRPVQNAMVMLKAKASDWSATTNSDANGEFTLNAVPLGKYSVTVAGSGFEQAQQDVLVTSSSQPVLHLALNVAGAKETISVSAPLEAAPTDSATPTTVVDRLEIIVADDGSADETPQIIRDFSRTSGLAAQFVTHPHDGFHLTRCRNDAARLASAPYLLFLDGDNLAHAMRGIDNVFIRLESVAIAGAFRGLLDKHLRRFDRLFSHRRPCGLRRRRSLRRNWRRRRAGDFRRLGAF